MCVIPSIISKNIIHNSFTPRIISTFVSISVRSAYCNIIKPKVSRECIPSSCCMSIIFIRSVIIMERNNISSFIWSLISSSSSWTWASWRRRGWVTSRSRATSFSFIWITSFFSIPSVPISVFIYTFSSSRARTTWASWTCRRWRDWRSWSHASCGAYPLSSYRITIYSCSSRTLLCKIVLSPWKTWSYGCT